MADDTCPECGKHGRALPPDAMIEYFYCEHCSTGWKVDPRDHDPVPVIVATWLRARTLP